MGLPLSFLSLKIRPKSFDLRTPFFRYSCIPDSRQTIRIGDAVSGAVSSTGGGERAARLSFWQFCSMNEWWTAVPRSLNDDGAQLPTDAIYKLPILGLANLPGHAGPSSRILFQPDRLRGAIDEALGSHPPPFSRDPEVAKSIAAKASGKAPHSRPNQKQDPRRSSRKKSSPDSLKVSASLSSPYRRLKGYEPPPKKFLSYLDS